MGLASILPFCEAVCRAVVILKAKHRADAMVGIILAVGLILVIALLTIPPFIAEKFTGSPKAMMAASSILRDLFTLIGLWLSYL